MEYQTVYETKAGVISLGELITELTKLQELHGSDCYVFKKTKTESLGLSTIRKREVVLDQVGKKGFSIQLS